ncbi:hypothetical protein ACH4VM_30910 [Streptomyces sp. NPDC020792]|uniref:hypothetical protein n=1 Tax=Streptomyces sp. NPDC020792 TaxID=3365089 RepID=UPI003787D9A9
MARSGQGGTNSFTPHVVGWGSLGILVLFVLTGYIGFESTAVFRDEARDHV